MIGSVYNYYLSTYGGKEFNKSDVHKKSELRSVYNAIVKKNKTSPLYKVNASENLQKYVIDIKENALSLKSAAEAFDDLSENSFSFKNKAVSSDENVAVAKYIGNNNDDAQSLELYVEKLATPQTNKGNYLKDGSVNMPAGKYSFDIGIGEYYYEFHTSIYSGDTNSVLQERAARLINNAKIGIIANVDYSIDGSSALNVQSVKTGVTDFKPQIFTISENDSDTLNGLVDYFGIGNVTTPASNAAFKINNMEKSSPSNVLNVINQYEITLKNTSTENKTTSISIEEDYESFIKDISNLVKNYNNIVELAQSKSEYASKNSSLHKELADIGSAHKNNLDSIGLTVNDNGTLHIDESLFVQSIKEGSLSESIGVINSFKNDIIVKSKGVSIDPMQYVNKTMVSYPHPTKPVVNPYITSIYTGMMFNGYI